MNARTDLYIVNFPVCSMVLLFQGFKHDKIRERHGERRIRLNRLLKLPVGIEDFKEIRQDHFYYVDKTDLIEQLLNEWSKVNLFTRPRRFGKTLNMSMLQNFFEIGTDPHLFDGLKISNDQELCDEYLGRFPVVSVSLKSVEADSYEDAKTMMAKLLNREARRLQFLSTSEKLTDVDRRLFDKLLYEDMDESTLISALLELTELLEKHFDQKVIILIDEYDVPLDKAFQHGYYDQMVTLLRGILGNALKTNSSLKFAVLTGCLRIAKESIFTGLNNFKVYSLTNVTFDEYFGFTDSEVKEMLHYYALDQDYTTVKEWYDGYQFGNIDVYCPWDVINYCADRRNDPYLTPQNYWANTSGNEIISRFIESLEEDKKLTKSELEQLVNGGTVQKEICQELTYKDLFSSMDNLWSTLLMTGYLSKRGTPHGNRYDLAVPNQEIRNILTDQILKLFRKQVARDGEMVNQFCYALQNGRANEVQQILTEYLKKTISVRDTFVHKTTKENFYHGILLGILSFKSGWLVKSNQESGDGFSDVLIQIDDADVGIIIEIKYGENGNTENECKKALAQICDKNYAEILHQADIHKILKYGIAFNRKTCMVMLQTESN